MIKAYSSQYWWLAVGPNDPVSWGTWHCWDFWAGETLQRVRRTLPDSLLQNVKGDAFVRGSGLSVQMGSAFFRTQSRFTKTEENKDVEKKEIKFYDYEWSVCPQIQSSLTSLTTGSWITVREDTQELIILPAS